MADVDMYGLRGGGGYFRTKNAPILGLQLCLFLENMVPFRVYLFSQNVSHLEYIFVEYWSLTGY